MTWAIAPANRLGQLALCRAAVQLASRLCRAIFEDEEARAGFRHCIGSSPGTSCRGEYHPVRNDGVRIIQGVEEYASQSIGTESS